MLRSLLVLVFVGAILVACTQAQDFSTAYESYEETYRQQHPYIVHDVERNGLTLHAREFVPLAGGGAPGSPIILMHGFPDSLHLHDLVAPQLAIGRRVITFDFLGWGHSDKPVDHIYDVASQRRDLEAVIDHFDLETTVLIVHDSSGQPGIDYTLDNPGRVTELVLLNTYYGPSSKVVPPPAIDRFSTAGIWRDLLVFGANRSDSRWLSGFMDQVGQFFEDDQVRDTYLPLFAHQALHIRPAFFGLNRVLHAEIAARAERLDALRRLTVPTKIIFGAEDPFLNADVAREFHEILPNSQLHLVEGGAHYVQLDRPNVVAKLVLTKPSS